MAILRRLQNRPVQQVLLIAYDISDDDNRSEILDEIIELGEYVPLSESSYAVQTNMKVDEVWKRLRKLEPFTSRGDRLYVTRLRGPVSGRGPRSHLQWLRSNLSPVRR